MSLSWWTRFILMRSVLATTRIVFISPKKTFLLRANNSELFLALVVQARLLNLITRSNNLSRITNEAGITRTKIFPSPNPVKQLKSTIVNP